MSFATHAFPGMLPYFLTPLSTKKYRSTTANSEEYQSDLQMCNDNTTKSDYQGEVRTYTVFSGSTRVSSMTSLPEGSVKDTTLCSKTNDFNFNGRPSECIGLKNRRYDERKHKTNTKKKYNYRSKKHQAFQDLSDLTPRQIKMVEASQEILAESKNMELQKRTAESECSSNSQNCKESNKSVVVKMNHNNVSTPAFDSKNVHNTVVKKASVLKNITDDNFDSVDKPNVIDDVSLSKCQSNKRMSSPGTRFFSRITNSLLQKRDWVKEKLQVAKEKVNQKRSKHKISDYSSDVENKESLVCRQKNYRNHVDGNSIKRYQLVKENMPVAIEEKIQNSCSVEYSSGLQSCHDSIKKIKMSKKQEPCDDVFLFKQTNTREHAKNYEEDINVQCQPTVSIITNGQGSRFVSKLPCQSVKEVSYEEKIFSLSSLVEAAKRKGLNEIINQSLNKRKASAEGRYVYPKDNPTELKKRKWHTDNSTPILSGISEKMSDSERSHMIEGHNSLIHRNSLISASSNVTPAQSFPKPQLQQHITRHTDPSEHLSSSSNQPSLLNPPLAHSINKLFQLEHMPLTNKRNLLNVKETTSYYNPSTTVYNDRNHTHNPKSDEMKNSDYWNTGLPQEHTYITNILRLPKIKSTYSEITKNGNNTKVNRSVISSMVENKIGNKGKSAPTIARSQISTIPVVKTTLDKDNFTKSLKSNASQEKSNQKESISPCPIPGTWVFVPDSSLNVDWKSFFVSQTMQMSPQTQHASRKSQGRLAGISQPSLSLSTSYQNIAPKTSYSNAVSSRYTVVSSSKIGTAAPKPATHQNRDIKELRNTYISPSGVHIQSNLQGITNVMSQPKQSSIHQKLHCGNNLGPIYPYIIPTGQSFQHTKNMSIPVTDSNVAVNENASNSCVLQVSTMPSPIVTSGVRIVPENTSRCSFSTVQRCSSSKNITTAIAGSSVTSTTDTSSSCVFQVTAMPSSIVSSGVRIAPSENAMKSVDVTFATKDQGLLFMTFKGTMQGFKRTFRP